MLAATCRSYQAPQSPFHTFLSRPAVLKPHSLDRKHLGMLNKMQMSRTLSLRGCDLASPVPRPEKPRTSLHPNNYTLALCLHVDP